MRGLKFLRPKPKAVAATPSAGVDGEEGSDLSAGSIDEDVLAGPVAAKKKKPKFLVTAAVLFVVLMLGSVFGYALFIGGPANPPASRVAAAPMMTAPATAPPGEPAPTLGEAKEPVPPVAAVTAPAAPAPVTVPVKTVSPVQVAAAVPVVAAKPDEPRPVPVGACNMPALDLKKENPYKAKFMEKYEGSFDDKEKTAAKPKAGEKSEIDRLNDALKALTVQVQQPKATAAPAKQHPANLEVYGILINGNDRFVMTNLGKYRQGDSINGITIIEIRDGGAQLETGFAPLSSRSVTPGNGGMNIPVPGSPYQRTGNY